MHKLTLEITDKKIFEALLEIIQNLPADKVKITELKSEIQEQDTERFSTYKSYSSYRQQMNDFLDQVLKDL
jgi:hypothetical protein